MTDAMDGNIEFGDVNKKRSESCYVIDELSAQNVPNGLDHTDDMNEAQQWSVAKDQPQPTSPQLTPTKHCPPHQMREPSTSITKLLLHRSTKWMEMCCTFQMPLPFQSMFPCFLSYHTLRPVCLHPLGMSVLPALGLFTGHGKGCHACASSLCSTVCCCEPDSLEPMLDMTHHCGFCGCLDAHCCLCGGPEFECCVCDICIQTTECLDLGMEISQMLFH
ncbi:unnamed protein product [Coregonus sp. 'balchen']|nr:unnamed protein product [Coregonus sp. 'balchen']